MNQPQDSAPAAGDTAGQATPGYGTPGPPQPGYGTPAGQTVPGYGTPGPPPGYGTPGPPPGYGTPGPPPGYGTPGPPPGYGSPAGQAYPAYPQGAYGQPYPAYGNQLAGQDPALAEWWRRLLARVIDGAILIVIFAPLWVPPWSTFFRTLRRITDQYPAGTRLGTIPAAKNAIATAEGHLVGKLFIVAAGFYLVAFIYDWIQHSMWGQTIGKRALGTRVVKADGNPQVGAGSACGRAAIYALSPLVPFVGWLFDLLNELWLTWDPRRQCLHDKAAHTVVVKKDYQGPQPHPGGW